MVLKDRARRCAIVIETKIVDSEEKMSQACSRALEQIEEKQYAKKIERSGFRNVIRYGVAFYKKECLVKKV